MSTGHARLFGDLVRRLRIAAALSQEELAERAGLSVRGISDLERGIRKAPRLETVRMLADALGLAEANRAELIAAARPEPESRDAERSFTDRPASLGSLPIPPTRLIGREAEAATLSVLLAESDARLVTLTGPGGTGKTHLTLAVAAEMRDRYPDGVWFVDLSALTDPLLVMPTIAVTLGVQERVGQALGHTLAEFLIKKHLLLILDNCEQVLAAASDIATLLAACPDLNVIATSREPLHIRAERVFAVAPLALPDPDRLPALAHLADVPAIALFAERAGAATVDFSLTEENAAAIASICWRLDGLPLAIELAASRIRLLPPAALLERLENRLPLLTGGARDGPARQRTMRDTIAWSYDLLRPEEQALFRHLAVFAGGFTLAAAEAVANFVRRSIVLDGVGALIEQSLLRQMPGTRGEPRYLMLETVREFGLERLTSAGEEEDVRSRHALHYLSLSDSQNQGIWSDWSLELLTDIVVNCDNVRLALAWFHQHGEGTNLLRLSAILYGFWVARGLYSEGVEWVEQALEQSIQVTDIVRFQALRAVGVLALLKGDYTRATTYIADGLTLARDFGDPLLIGEALTSAGLLAYRRGEYGQAEDLLAESVQFLHELPDTVPDAPRATGAALRALGDNALAQEQFTVAVGRYEASLRLASNAWGLADANSGLGAISYCSGDYALAAVHYSRCLGESQNLGGDALLVVTYLHGMAGIASAGRNPEAGARLLGAAEGIAASLETPIFPRDQPVLDRCLTTLTAALGEERLGAVRESGRALTMEQAINEARTVAAVAGQSHF